MDEMIDLTTCFICGEPFGSKYRHLDSIDTMRENKVPIQSMVCTHIMCFPCVESYDLVENYTGVRRKKKTEAHKCPLCNKVKAFSINGRVNLAACALSKLVGEQRVQSSVEALTLLDADASIGISSSLNTDPSSSSSSAVAKRPPSDPEGTPDSVAQAAKKRAKATKKRAKAAKKKAKAPSKSPPKSSPQQDPSPSAAAGAATATADFALFDERPVRKRKPNLTLTHEWNDDHEKKLAAKELVLDWDVLSHNDPGDARRRAERNVEVDAQPEPTMTHDALGLSNGLATTGERAGASSEHGSAHNMHGSASGDALNVVGIVQGTASTEEHLNCQVDASTSSPAMVVAWRALVSAHPTPPTLESGRREPVPTFVESPATGLVVGEDSNVHRPPSHLDGLSGLGELTHPVSDLISSTVLRQSEQEHDDPELASVIEVDPPAREAASICSISDDSDDDDYEDPQSSTFLDHATSSVAHRAPVKRPFAEIDTAAPATRLPARNQDAMRRLTEAFDISPISDAGSNNTPQPTLTVSQGEGVAAHATTAPAAGALPSNYGDHADANRVESCDDGTASTKLSDDDEAFAMPPVLSGYSGVLPPKAGILFVEGSHRDKCDTKDDVSVIDLTGDESDDDVSVIDLTGDDDSVCVDCDEMDGL